jgi:hypothetical protein
MSRTPEFDNDSRRKFSYNDLEDCAHRRGASSTPFGGSEPERQGGVSSNALPDFLEAHAVSPDVAAARGYQRYERGDTERLRQHWPSDTPADKAHITKVVRGCGGIVIPRYAPPGMVLPPVPAELRPDKPVWTKQEGHYQFHGDPPERWTKENWPKNPETLKPLFFGHVHSPLTMGMKSHIRKDHGGVNTQTVHWKDDSAKYIFPLGDGAKRLDVNPLAWPLFVGASRVFFCLEGCIKADAILSAWVAVFSVPSVTLWQARELTGFLTYLRGKEVIIVCDADWYENPAVYYMAMRCCERRGSWLK